RRGAAGATVSDPALSRRSLLRAGLGASALALARGLPARPAEEAPKQLPRVIDIHNHVYWLGHDPKKMVANMDRFGIDRSWLLSWEAPAREIDAAYDESLNPLGVGIPFSDIVRASEMFPERFVPGYAPDPRRPEARALLRSAVKLHGVRVFGELKVRMHYDDPDALAIFQLCGDLGLPVVFHLDVVLPPGSIQTARQYWYGGAIDNVERALQRCPRTQFIGHAPGFWREISGDAGREPLGLPRGKPVVQGGKILKLLDRYPNLHCDLSAGSGHTALSRDPAFSRKFLIDYQDRVLYGRDQYDNVHQELLRSLDLPKEALARVLAGNALRLVPL
ncbi:MAG: amidohydrolase family protein, partial [Thermoanaerobaculia bacterium]